MKIKRLLPLLVLASVGALAAPVGAETEEGPLWYIHVGEEEVLAPDLEAEEEAYGSAFKGEITIAAGAIATGPCKLEGQFKAGNKGVASGDLSAIVFPEECKVIGIPLSICAAEASAQNMPWPYSVKKAGNEVEFKKVTLNLAYKKPACQLIGIPKELSVAGTLTGKFANSAAEFEESGDLFVEGTPTPATVSGKFSAGEELTLK